MHDERQRPRGATGSTCAVAESKIDEDPKQLELWSAAQSNNTAIGTRQQRGASIDNTRPTRAPGQGAAPKFPLTEPIVSIRQAASSFDHEIRAPLRDELLVSAPSAGAQWFHPALVTGALAVALGLGWIGGSSSSLFFAPAPASTSVQQANSSGCTGESSKGTVCATTKSDRVMAGAPNTRKIASPEAAGVNLGTSCREAPSKPAQPPIEPPSRRIPLNQHRRRSCPDPQRCRRRGLPRLRAGRSATLLAERSSWRGRAASGGRRREIRCRE